AHGREEERRVELFGRQLVGSACPCRAKLAREALTVDVSRSGECEDAAALMHSDLRDEVRGGAEPVEADALRVARESQSTEADESCAEQRRSAEIVVRVRQREAVTLVRDRQLGVAPVDVVPGEP